VVWSKSTSQSSTTSKWAGKTWNAIGDSITEVNFRTSKNYHAYIAEKIGCTVNNYGVGGTGWFTPSSSGGTNQIFNRISSMSASADLITVFAGTNDWYNIGKTLVLGTLGDTDQNASLYGAVDYTIKQLIAKYPTQTIAVFTPIPRSNSYGNTGANATTNYYLRDVADAIIAVCKAYSIPCLDLFRNSSPLAPWNTTNKATYFVPDSGSIDVPNGDGLHPNHLGHSILADKILSFLNSL
jgi:lysophospholipase L1-like esterase